MLLLTALYAAYATARTLVDEAPGRAISNGRAVLRVERLLGLDVEQAAIDWLVQWTWLSVLASYAYAALHYTVTLTVLVWLYVRRPAHYRLARSVLVGTTCLALVCFWTLPTAPPRLLSVEYVDVLAATAPWGWWGDAASAPRGMASLTNQYAALPSMHVGWALWAGAAVALLARRRLVRFVAAGYPLVIGVVVVVTGNHYVLDALAGAAAVCLTAFLYLHLERLHRVRRTGFVVGRRSTVDDRAFAGRVLRASPGWAGLGSAVATGTPAPPQHPSRRDRGRRSGEEGIHTPDRAAPVRAVCGLCACRAGTEVERLSAPADDRMSEDR
jgi:hypothetical protein